MEDQREETMTDIVWFCEVMMNLVIPRFEKLGHASCVNR